MDTLSEIEAKGNNGRRDPPTCRDVSEKSLGKNSAEMKDSAGPPSHAAEQHVGEDKQP
jgi:hypothetical protein